MVFTGVKAHLSTPTASGLQNISLGCFVSVRLPPRRRIGKRRGGKDPVLLVSIIHPEGAAVRKREKHAGVVTLRDGDGGRLLARLTHRIVDFSKHTSEGAEEPSALCQWIK